MKIMISIVFLLLLVSVNSLEINFEHLTDPEGYVTKYKPNAHPEAQEIHTLLDTIDKRIFDSIKAAAWANITETNNILAEKVTEFYRLQNDTKDAQDALNAAVAKLTQAKSTLDAALADKNDARERRNSARSTHDIATSNLAQAESALDAAKSHQKRRTIAANDELTSSLGTLKDHATRTLYDLCKEVDLIHRIRLLVEQINTEYQHEIVQSPFLESCRTCIADVALIKVKCTTEEIVGNVEPATTEPATTEPPPPPKCKRTRATEQRRPNDGDVLESEGLLVKDLGWVNCCVRKGRYRTQLPNGTNVFAAFNCKNAWLRLDYGFQAGSESDDLIPKSLDDIPKDPTKWFAFGPAGQNGRVTTLVRDCKPCRDNI